ncbi:sulfotransferase [Gammaproteobacteria bacterium]|nr:sulfotransferase [Gammaproteobacteria bacterium]
MPNFIIIGGVKSGTTALYHYLAEHSQVYMSPIKEPNFFLFERTHPMQHLAMRDHYEAKFFELALVNSATSWEAYQALFNGVMKEKAVGEASAGYLHAKQVPERIFRYTPNVKLIAILRAPVERAFSHFLFFIRLGVEPTYDFSKAIRTQNCRTERYIEVGQYYRALKRYFSLFDKSRIKI